MRIRDAATFITFAMMLAIGAAYIGSLGVRVGTPAHRTNISMQVADINGLVVGSNVLLRGVPVGKISKIATSAKAATINFYIQDRFRVPVDSDVRLENLSALGETYIGLFPQRRDGPMLHDGQRIATERIVQPASISELATTVVRILNQADPDALKRIIGEADVALPNPNSLLPNLSRASKLLRSVAADMHGSGRDLLDNFQTLLRNAGWLGPVLAGLAPQIRTVGVQGGLTMAGFMLARYLGGVPIVDQFDGFLDRIQKLLDANAGDLKLLGDATLPHLKGIAGALMNFDTGQILSHVLESVPEDGAITLHVSIPQH